MPISATELLGIVTIRGADEGALKLLRVGESADSAGAKLGALAVGGTVLAAAGLIALGAAAVKMDADLQQGINRLRTGGGDIQDTFASLRSSIQSVALMSGVLTGPLTDAMYKIVSSGQRGAQAFATEAAAAQGAQIEMANVVDVTQILTTIQTDFGIKAHTAAQYMDGLVKAVSEGKISLEDLSTAMSPILPIAAELGIHFADVAAAMSVQTNAGLDAARSATGLQAVFVNMENPTAKAAAAMKKFGVDSTAVANEMKVSLPGAFQMLIDAALKVGPMGSVPFNQAMADMVGGGTRTAKTIDALDQNMNAWLSDIKDVNAAMGNTSANVAGWETAQSNLNIQLEKGQAFLQVLGQNIGEELLPYVSQLLADVIPLGESFAAWATSTQGLAGYINQLAAFVTYLVRDVQDNGALKEFGAILSDIGSTVNNVVNAALLTLSGLFGTTASQAGKASDAATNVAGGFKRVLDTVKPLTDALSWLTSQFTDVGVKGQILRGVLLTIGATIATIKFVEFGTSAVTAFTNAGIAAFGFGQKLIGVQAAATASATATAGAGTAATGAAASFASFGAAMVPLIGIAAAMTLALKAIPSPMHNILTADQSLLGILEQQQKMFQISVNSAFGWGQAMDETSQKVVLDFHNMYQGATDNTNRMRSGVTLAANTMANGTVETVTYMEAMVSGKFRVLNSDGSNYTRNLEAQVTTNFFNMHKQVYSETYAMSNDAVAAMARLNGDMTAQAASMDANVIGYWNDVANYIAGHPINGNITYSTGGSPTMQHFASGTNYAPGGPSWVAEGGQAELVVGPHLMNLPTGAGVYPLSQVGGRGGGEIHLHVDVYLDGTRMTGQLMPRIVNQIRQATGARF